MTPIFERLKPRRVSTGLTRLCMKIGVADIWLVLRVPKGRASTVDSRLLVAFVGLGYSPLYADCGGKGDLLETLGNPYPSY